jgi:hypothetical protein
MTEEEREAKREQLNEINYHIQSLRECQRDLEDKIQKIEQQILVQESAAFKIVYGVGYGETFKFNGRDYVIVNQFTIKPANGKNERRADGLRDFLKEKSQSPYVRATIDWGPIKLK